MKTITINHPWQCQKSHSIFFLKISFVKSDLLRKTRLISHSHKFLYRTQFIFRDVVKESMQIRFNGKFNVCAIGGNTGPDYPIALKTRLSNSFYYNNMKTVTLSTNNNTSITQRNDIINYLSNILFRKSFSKRKKTFINYTLYEKDRLEYLISDQTILRKIPNSGIGSFFISFKQESGMNREGNVRPFCMLDILNMLSRSLAMSLEKEIEQMMMSKEDITYIRIVRKKSQPERKPFDMRIWESYGSYHIKIIPYCIKKDIVERFVEKHRDVKSEEETYYIKY